MATDFSIKINRRDGALEISGPEQAWVDSKLTELSAVYLSPLPAVPEDGDDSGGGPRPTQPRAKRPSKAKPVNNSGNGTDGTAKPNRPRRSGGRPQRNPELESKLTREVLHKFMAYIEERQGAWDKKQTHQAAIIATFLEDELGWQGINEDDMYTVYRSLSMDGPTNYRSMLQNAYGRDKFFTGTNDGRYSLSIGGEKFGRNTSRDS